MSNQNNETDRNFAAISQQLSTMVGILDKIQKTLVRIEEKSNGNNQK